MCLVEITKTNKQTKRKKERRKKKKYQIITNHVLIITHFCLLTLESRHTRPPLQLRTAACCPASWTGRTAPRSAFRPLRSGRPASSAWRVSSPIVCRSWRTGHGWFLWRFYVSCQAVSGKNSCRERHSSLLLQSPLGLGTEVIGQHRNACRDGVKRRA